MPPLPLSSLDPALDPAGEQVLSPRPYDSPELERMLAEARNLSAECRADWERRNPGRKLSTAVNDWRVLPDTEEGRAIYVRYGSARWVISTLVGRQDAAVCALNQVALCRSCRTEFPHAGWIGRRCPSCSVAFVDYAGASSLLAFIRATGLTSVYTEHPGEPRGDVLDFEEL